MISITGQVNDTVRWPTLQCMWRTIECGDEHNSTSERYSGIINTTAQEYDRVRWSKQQCKWTVQFCDKNLVWLTKDTVVWTTLQCVWKTIQSGDQHYSASEVYSAMIKCTMKENNTMRWRTQHYKWTIEYGEQHYSANERYSACDERYSGVINTAERVTRNTLR
jgi:hypothetical protein